MSKNHMAEVAKILGVEMGEEFNVDGFTCNPCKITEDGLINYAEIPCGEVLAEVLNGNHEIIKKPWKPKENEIYYFICMDGSVASMEFWHCIVEDALSIRAGNFFKTREEAEANVDKFLEYIKQEPDLSWRVDG